MRTIRLSTQVGGDGATSGQVPTWDGTKWVPQTPASVATPAFHGTKVWRSTNQSAATGVWTAVSWDSEVWDTDAYHDPATNPTRITIPTGLTGKISFHGQILFSGVGAATGVDVGLRVWKNGTTEICRFEQPTPNPATINNTLQTHGADLATTAGDYYELQAFQANAGAINIAGSAAFSWFVVTLLG